MFSKWDEAEKTLRKWYQQADRALDNAEPYSAIVNALSDDLNTPKAIAEMHQLSHADDVPTLRASLKFLGLMGETTPTWAAMPEVDLSNLEIQLAMAREQAMETKDFSEVDRLKSALIEAGVEVRMSKAGVELKPTSGFDASKLEGLT